MPWGLPSPAPSGSNNDDGNSNLGAGRTTLQMTGTDRPRRTSPKNEDASWIDSLRDGIQTHFKEPHNWIAPVAAAGLSLGLWSFYHAYLRRIPASGHIAPSFFRRRSLFGKVTSVGDGDGFHLFHTPGGRLAGWGWLRRVPKERKELKGGTISVRIAGVDAPEGAHFGKPAQPFAAEALSYLESYILRRRVRAYIYKRDQYERVVATVYVRKAPFFLRKDVGMEMIKRGLAVTYEGKTGAEFGGKKMEERYRAAEAVAKRKGRGLWGLKGVESPMEFKKRMKGLDEKNGVV